MFVRIIPTCQSLQTWNSIYSSSQFKAEDYSIRDSVLVKYCSSPRFVCPTADGMITTTNINIFCSQPEKNIAVERSWLTIKFMRYSWPTTCRVGVMWQFWLKTDRLSWWIVSDIFSRSKNKCQSWSRIFMLWWIVLFLNPLLIAYFISDYEQ